ncbi:MAG: PAS domain S-box protein [Pseudomonadota bacterium]
MELPKTVSEQLLKAAPDAAIVSDNNGRIVYANDKALRLFGFDAEELVGQSVELLIPEAHRERHVRLRDAYSDLPHARPLLSGLELSARRKNGEEFRAEIALTPVKTEDGGLIASTIREIDVVSGSEAYFRTLLETAPDAMIIVDANGAITVVNSQTESMFGYTREQLLGQSIEKLLPLRMHQIHRLHRESYITRPEVRPMGQGRELLGLRSNGEEFPVEISLSPVETEAGRFVSSTVRDVTERDRMEKQIIAARQEAERANKANTAFLAAASHDLRQPVQALSLLNGALRRTVKDERALAMIDSQENSLTAMTNLLNSLLDISRLDAGAITPEFEEFPMSRVIDRLAAEFGRQAQHKGLSFSAQSCQTMVRSDPSLLGEVLQNLVSNSIRYTEQGAVTISCAHVGETCRLEVRDTGVGIAEDELESIFLEFNQGSSRTASKEGFGLGLAIVRRMADLLGVNVGVESELGIGSCFSLQVPAVESQVAPVEEPTRKRTNNELSSGLILLIEDNVNVADAWALLLEAEGYTVRKTVSAQETIDLLDVLDESPALVISDFHLAEGSTGVDAINAVRARFENGVPAFIVSGDTSKVVPDARPVENCKLFSKPVNTDELLDAAKRAVERGVVE